MHVSHSLVLLGSNSFNVDTFLPPSLVRLSASRLLTSRNQTETKIHSTKATCNDMGDTRPSHHADSSASSFKNPWMQPKRLLESGQGFLNSFPLSFAKLLHDHPAQPVKVIAPDWGKDEPDEGRVKATWLGHAVSQNKVLDQATSMVPPGISGSTPSFRRSTGSTDANNI